MLRPPTCSYILKIKIKNSAVSHYTGTTFMALNKLTEDVRYSFLTGKKNIVEHLAK
jgi:hypothetical protein